MGNHTAQCVYLATPNVSFTDCLTINIRNLYFIYWVPQNSRNNSVGQCQITLDNYEKNNLKNLCLLVRFEDMGAQKVQF
jgi:hypothetical protein